MLTHIYAGVRQLCLHRARSGYVVHVYTVVLPKKEPGNSFYEGNHYLHLKNPNQPQTRLVDGNPDKDLFLDEFVWVSGSWEFRAGDDNLWSFSR